MKKEGHITSFYIEVLLLIVVLIMIVLVLTRVFATSRAESAAAADLTRAVCLAQNAAEAVPGARDARELAALLDEGGNVRTEDGIVEARYDADMRPSAENARYIVRIAGTAECGVVEYTISVYCGGTDGEPVYTLKTAAYTGEGAA